jgi:hypothetical protein
VKVDLKCDLPFEEFIDPLSITEIVDSRTFRNGDWKPLTNLKNALRGSSKNVIPVDLSYSQILVVTTGKPGSVTPTHSHDEPVLRYIVEGSLYLNENHYSKGEWVLVPANFPYTIRTDEGYVVVNPYDGSCWSRMHE